MTLLFWRVIKRRVQCQHLGDFERIEGTRVFWLSARARCRDCGAWLEDVPKQPESVDQTSATAINLLQSALAKRPAYPAGIADCGDPEWDGSGWVHRPKSMGGCGCGWCRAARERRKVYR